MPERERWSRDQLLVAMNIYEKLPFGQFNQENPVIKDVAGKLGRSPSSLAMKLCNLASLDPAIVARGRKGLVGASNLDRAVWNEFRGNPEILGPASEEAFRRLFTSEESDEVDLVKGAGVRVKTHLDRLPPVGDTVQEATVLVRRGQQFFRQMILNAFESRCCVTGIGVRELLVASHIKPWGTFPGSRLDLRNGLCLSRLHDAAFDRGLISFDDECRLLLSRELRDYLPQPSIEHNFVGFAGCRITIPTAHLGPNVDFLRYHRDAIFRG